MATTAVFAEIVVVGLQVEAWLALLVLALFGTDWISLSELADWSVLLTLVALAGAYMFGVVVDRIADNAWRSAYRLAQRRNWRTGPHEREFRRWRFEVMHESEGLGKFLDYQRSRLRVARATAFNAALLIPVAGSFLAGQPDASFELWLATGCFTLALIAASAYTAIAINGAWEDSVREAHAAIDRRRRAGGVT